MREEERSWEKWGGEVMWTVLDIVEILVRRVEKVVGGGGGGGEGARLYGCREGE